MLSSRFTQKLIRFVVKKAFLCASLFALVSGTLLLVKRFNILQDSLHRDLLPLYLCVAVVLIYKPIDRKLNQLFRKFLFHREKNIKSLTHLPMLLLQTRDLKESANYLVNSLGEGLHLAACGLLVWDKTKERFVLASSFGLSVQQALKCEMGFDDPLIQLVRDKKGPVIKDQVIPGLTWQEANRLERNFELLQAHVIWPVFDEKNRLIAFLSACRMLKSYLAREEDARFFKSLMSYASVSIANSLHVDRLRKKLVELKSFREQFTHSPKLSAIEQLAVGIAHEIHNPLTVISGRAQVMLLKKSAQSDPEKIESTLKTIVAQTKRASEITRKLTLFAEASKGRKEWVSLENIIDDTLALASYRMSLDQIQIRKRMDATSPMFYGDVTELRELFLNLILNAAQAIGKNGVVSVVGKFSANQKKWDIKIADTGSGIAPEDLPRLFDPFFTTRHESVGLGLYVVRQIATRYGGNVKVESEQGKGTIVCVSLPQSCEKSEAGDLIVSDESQIEADESLIY